MIHHHYHHHHLHYCHHCHYHQYNYHHHHHHLTSLMSHNSVTMLTYFQKWKKKYTKVQLICVTPFYVLSNIKSLFISCYATLPPDIRCLDTWSDVVHSVPCGTGPVSYGQLYRGVDTCIDRRDQIHAYCHMIHVSVACVQYCHMKLWPWPSHWPFPRSHKLTENIQVSIRVYLQNCF